MRLFTRLAALTVATAISAGAAVAADPIVFQTSTEEALPVYDDSGFDWTGFYAGIYGVGNNSPVGGFQYGGGALVGANAAFDAFVLGAELGVHGLTGTSNVYGQVVAKAGVLLTDDILLYAAGGYGTSFGAPLGSHALLGGGAEVAIADNVSLRAQYLHGFPLTGAEPVEQVTLGANFHF